MPALLADESDKPPVGVGVDIYTPRPRAEVSGLSTVDGTASSVVRIDRVELRLRGSVVDYQDFEPSSNVSFRLEWKTSRGDVGSNWLEVVACGSGAVGKSSVEVTVPPRRPLWVGAVVGLAGLAGLTVSLGVFPRRANDVGTPEPVQRAGPLLDRRHR